MNEDEQWEELRQVTKNPMILLSAGARETILYLADKGETQQIRHEAKRLINSVPCPTCE